MDFIYVEVGDKLNYAACVKKEDESLRFCGWIRKYCIKEDQIVVKAKKEELVYK